MADLNLYGHPFQAIWQQVAGDLGITTGRMRDIALDQQAEQERQLRGQNIALAEVIRTGTPEEQQVAAQQMRDVAQQTAANIQSIGATGRPAYNIPSAAQMVAPYYAGRAASAADLQNKMFEVTKQRRDEFHNEITAAQNFRDQRLADIDSLVDLTNKLGADSDVVQSKARDLAGMTLGDARAAGGDIGSIGAHGIGHVSIGALLGIDPQTKLDYSDLMKLSGSLRDTVQKFTGAKIDALQKHAIAAGFSLDPNTGGLLDINVPHYDTSPTPPRPENASDQLTGPPSLYDLLAQKLTPVSTTTANIAESVLGGAQSAGANTRQTIREALGMPETVKMPDGTLVDRVDLGQGRFEWRPHTLEARRRREASIRPKNQ